MQLADGQEMLFRTKKHWVQPSSGISHIEPFNDLKLQEVRWSCESGLAVSECQGIGWQCWLCVGYTDCQRYQHEDVTCCGRRYEISSQQSVLPLASQVVRGNDSSIASEHLCTFLFGAWRGYRSIKSTKCGAGNSDHLSLLRTELHEACTWRSRETTRVRCECNGEAFHSDEYFEHRIIQLLDQRARKTIWYTPSNRRVDESQRQTVLLSNRSHICRASWASQQHPASHEHIWSLW